MTMVTEQRVGARGWARRVVTTGALALVFGAGIAGLMLTLAGRFEPKADLRPPPPTPRRSTPERAVGVVQRVRRPREESAVGTVRAVYEAVVASKLLARVEQVRVKAGQEVKLGEILVVLDKADLEARIAQASAAERAAQAKYEQAVIDQGRVDRLRARGSATQSELDQANTALRTARADLERARRTAEEAGIVESYATVRAPIGGRVIDKKVNAGDTVIPGQMLLTMYDPTHMQLVATVRESLALRLKPGQQLRARIDTLGFDCHATISEIVPEAQAESRSFQVKVTGPCPPNVYSGMFGRLFIPVDDEDVVIVPEAAIRRVGQLDEVDVVGADGVSRRVVQLGRMLPEGREVLSGLADGERVVLAASDGGGS